MAVYHVLFSYVIVYGITPDFPFRNISLSWTERVNDLVGRLTVDEIMYQMASGGGDLYPPAPSISRLGVGPYQWDTECLSGDVFAGNATSFPQPIGLAASFSPDLVFRVAEATSIEVRAKHNNYTKHGTYGARTGLSCFSPVINIMRHPLWGRNQETYGEDPFLSGVYATQFVKGLQGNHPRYVRASAGCKHFDAYAGPENIPSSRFSFNSVVSERDWRLTFLPAFKQCVDAGTYSLMCSYNSINGIPACANYKLLTKILREEWNFTGYVVSDSGATSLMVSDHHYYLNNLDTVTGCINAGCNLELGGIVFLNIYEAISKSLLMESTVRERVKPLFYTRMRLGEFDPPSMNPYTQLNLTVIESDKHRQLAIEAAGKSYVLLKNTKDILPFTKRIPNIAVIGPMANNSEDIFGLYSPNSDPRFTITALNGLENLANEVKFTEGCNDGVICKNYSSHQVKHAVQDADIVFVCLGTGKKIESEGNDRSSVELPGNQLKLLQDAVNYSYQVQVVLVLFSAGPVNITWAEDNEMVMAIIQCFLPAQATGEALFNLMVGNVKPAARLPYTWYRDLDQIPSMIDYSMTERTYRYFTGEPLYPFGYGLSYTTFQYSNLAIPLSVEAGDSIPVEVSVNNIGEVDSDEVVQVYISWLTTTEKMPNLQLVGFDRIFVPKGKTVIVNVTITPNNMAVWTDDKGFVVEPGSIKVYVGGQQPNQKKTVNSNVLSSIVKINGFRHI